MSRTFGWDLPPGVSPNDPHIAGYPPCASCGHPEEDHHSEEITGEGEGTLVVIDVACQECDCEEYQQYPEIPDEPDPDEAYDRKREEHLW